MVGLELGRRSSLLPIWCFICLLQKPCWCSTPVFSGDQDVVIVGSVLSLSQSSDSIGKPIVSGLRFWEEHTNLQGGIMLPSQRRAAVRLIIYDDGGDAVRAAELYQQLAEVDSARFFLCGGGAASHDEVHVIASRNAIVSLWLEGSEEFPPTLRPWFFYTHALSTGYSTDMFPTLALEGVRKFAVLYNEDNRRSYLAGTTVVAFLGAVGLETTFSMGLPDGHWNHDDAMRRMADSGTHFLFICSKDSADAAKAMDAITEAGILYGWDAADAGEDSLVPGFVDTPTSLKLILMTDAAEGAPEEAFKDTVGGWANQVMTSMLFHPELGYADPFFGSTTMANDLWKSRQDYGNGADLPPIEASAIAAGVALRLGIERAANLTTHAVAEALRGLDEETLYGAVQFDEWQRNKAQAIAMVQWLCDERDCARKIVFPLQRAGAQMRLLPSACPQGSLPSMALSAPDGADPEPVGECRACLSADADDVSELLSSSRSLKHACPVFADPIKVVADWNGRANTEVLNEALRFARDLVARDPRIMPNVPLELLLPSGEGEGSDGAGLEMLQSVVREGGGVVSSAAGATCVNDLSFSWMNHSVGIAAPRKEQGRGLARAMEHFRWQRAHVLSSEGNEAMLAAYVAAAADLNIEITTQLFIPKGRGRPEALERVAELDDCAARIIVLCVDTEDAEELFGRLDAGREWVLLGSEATTRAENKPAGLIGLRAVPLVEGTRHAELALHLQTTGLMVGEVSHGAGGEAAEVDAASFVADALVAMLSAVWSMLKESKDVTCVDALADALARTRFDGASGLVEFNDKMERSTGRFALLNWDGQRQVEIGVWDMEANDRIGHTAEPLNEWEHQVVWPRADGSVAAGPTPDDVCACLVWRRMGPHSEFARCTWTAEAVVVVAVGLVVLAGCCVLAVRTCWRWNEQLDWEERQVVRHMGKARRRLRATRKDGFLLSSERRWWRVWEKDMRVIPRPHLEAVARLLLLKPFDVRSFDAFARHFNAEEPYKTVVVAGQGPDASQLFLKSFRTEVPLGDVQYFELSKLLLGMVRMLLEPAAPNHDAATASLLSSEQSPIFTKTGSTAVTSAVSTATDDREVPRTAGERFKYLQEHVFKLQIWADRDHAMFKALKSSVVQELMGDLRAKCDQLFATIVKESGGDALIAFPAGKLLRSLQTSHDSPPRPPSPLALLPSAEASQDWGGDLVLSVEERRGRDGGGSTRRRPSSRMVGTPRNRICSAFDSDEGGSPLCAVRGRAEGLAAQRPRAGEGGVTGSLVVEIPTLTSESDMTGGLGSANDNGSKVNGAKVNGAKVNGGKVDELDLEDAGSPPRSPAASPAKLDAGRPVPSLRLPAVRSLPSPLGRRPAVYEAVTRQDHPLVLAIRQDEEDLVEAEMQRERTQGAFGGDGEAPVVDEELYITALHRRACLLDEEFQDRVRAAVTAFAGCASVRVPDDARASSSPRGKEGAGGGRRRSVGGSAEGISARRMSIDALAASMVGRDVDKVLSAQVKTKARMRDKLSSYADGAASPASPRRSGGWKSAHAHPLTANILDPIRASVLCSGPLEVVATAEWLLEHGHEVGLPVVRIKNKFSLEDSSEYDGYRDMMVCVLFTGERGLRIIGEIQIHDVRLYQLKLHMHKLYKVKRAAAAATV